MSLLTSTVNKIIIIIISIIIYYIQPKHYPHHCNNIASDQYTYAGDEVWDDDETCL